MRRGIDYDIDGMWSIETTEEECRLGTRPIVFVVSGMKRKEREEATEDFYISHAPRYLEMGRCKLA